MQVQWEAIQPKIADFTRRWNDMMAKDVAHKQEAAQQRKQKKIEQEQQRNRQSLEDIAGPR